MKLQCPLCKVPCFVRSISKNNNLVNIVLAYQGLKDSIESLYEEVKEGKSSITQTPKNAPIQSKLSITPSKSITEPRKIDDKVKEEQTEANEVEEMASASEEEVEKPEAAKQRTNRRKSTPNRPILAKRERGTSKSVYK